MKVLSILVLGALVPLTGCGASHPDRVASPPDPRSWSTDEFAQKSAEALEGDLESSEEVLEYVSEFPRKYSEEDRVRWAEIAFRNGSDLGGQVYIVHLLAQRDCVGARKAYTTYAALPSYEEAEDTLLPAINRICER